MHIIALIKKKVEKLAMKVCKGAVKDNVRDCKNNRPNKITA